MLARIGRYWKPGGLARCNIRMGAMQHLDPYDRERQRAMSRGDGTTAGIALTVILLAFGLGAVAFVYLRG